MINDKYLEIYEKGLKCSPFELMILIFIYEEKSDFLRIFYDYDFMYFKAYIRSLEAHGLVKWFSDKPEDITLRKAGEELFKKYVGKKKKEVTAREVGVWIDSWRTIFPAGVNTGGYRYRGDRGEVLKKMIKFVNSYKYTEEEIFKATKDYVERFSLKGYTFMQLAHYFIEKKGVGSTLASECEGLNETDTKQEGSGYGTTII